MRIRWYPHGERETHLRAFTFDGSPIWGTYEESAFYFDEDMARAALKACRRFHGTDEDIVLVRVRRTTHPITLCTQTITSEKGE